MKNFEEYLSEIKRVAEEEGYDTLDEIFVEHLRARFFGEDVIIGQTQRLRLREIKLSDLDFFYGFTDVHQEPVLHGFIKENRAQSEENLQAYISHMYPLYDYGIWTVEKSDTGEIIGLCGLGQTEIDGECCTDLGYYICPKCRKRGFATECIEFVLDYAKNYLEFPVIYAIIKEENTISKGILRKFGFYHLKMCESSKGMVSVYQKDIRK